jgi:hypothetical protein
MLYKNPRSKSWESAVQLYGTLGTRPELASYVNSLRVDHLKYMFPEADSDGNCGSRTHAHVPLPNLLGMPKCTSLTVVAYVEEDLGPDAKDYREDDIEYENYGLDFDHYTFFDVLSFVASACPSIEDFSIDGIWDIGSPPKAALKIPSSLRIMHMHDAIFTIRQSEPTLSAFWKVCGTSIKTLYLSDSRLLDMDMLLNCPSALLSTLERIISAGELYERYQQLSSMPYYFPETLQELECDFAGDMIIRKKRVFKSLSRLVLRLPQNSSLGNFADIAEELRSLSNALSKTQFPILKTLHLKICECPVFNFGTLTDHALWEMMEDANLGDACEELGIDFQSVVVGESWITSAPHTLEEYRAKFDACECV